MFRCRLSLAPKLASSFLTPFEAFCKADGGKAAGSPDAAWKQLPMAKRMAYHGVPRRTATDAHDARKLRAARTTATTTTGAGKVATGAAFAAFEKAYESQVRRRYGKTFGKDTHRAAAKKWERMSAAVREGYSPKAVHIKRPSAETKVLKVKPTTGLPTKLSFVNTAAEEATTNTLEPYLGFCKTEAAAVARQLKATDGHSKRLTSVLATKWKEMASDAKSKYAGMARASGARAGKYQSPSGELFARKSTAAAAASSRAAAGASKVAAAATGKPRPDVARYRSAYGAFCEEQRDRVVSQLTHDGRFPSLARVGQALGSRFRRLSKAQQRAYAYDTKKAGK